MEFGFRVLGFRGGIGFRICSSCKQATGNASTSHVFSSFKLLVAVSFMSRI